MSRVVFCFLCPSLETAFLRLLPTSRYKVSAQDFVVLAALKVGSEKLNSYISSQ